MGVTVTGLDEAIATLEGVKRRASDLSPVLAIAAADTVAVIDDAFETSTSPSGVGWAALKPSTLRHRRGTNAKILVDTGVLRNSVNSRADGNRLLFGAGANYGRYAQTGTRRMVARPFLPVDGPPGAYSLGSSGTAGRHWDSVRAMVKRYVLTGRV